MRSTAVLLPLLLPLVSFAQAAPPSKPAAKPTPKTTNLPLTQVTLYKNGVGLFEQSGTVSGDALVQINFPPNELNDVLQSLTAVDHGNGNITGLGYNSAASFGQQFNLGPDPTVADLLRTLKGKRVEVRSTTGTATGKLFNLEVRSQRDPKTAEIIEHRFLTVITAQGGLRTVELTPTVEVRMLDTAEKQEIGRYLQMVAAAHDGSPRHFTLEDRGTGERQLEVSYLNAAPSWKSSYRLLVTTPPNDAKGDSAAPETATLQGWASVDNASTTDWDNVQLTLIAGSPQNSVPGPKTLPPQYLGGRDPIPGARSLVAINASSIGGGTGFQIQAAKPAPATFQQEAKNSVRPDTTSTRLDDLFEYKLSKPMTIKQHDSAMVPLLQTEIEAERVTFWHSNGERRAMRAIWLKNTSSLTLDPGSFSITEDGRFGGQAQLGLLHPNERQILPYAPDDAVLVKYVDTTHPPVLLRSVTVANGVLSVHHRNYTQINYVIQNLGTAPRKVLIERPIDPDLQISSDTPATETTDKLHRFLVDAPANATTKFRVLESHAKPVRFELARITVKELEDVLKEAKDDPNLVAQLQPILDAKRKLLELEKQLKADQVAMDDVEAEQRRLRQNIATLKDTAEEKPLAKRYTAAMLTQEDKLATLKATRETDRQQKLATEKLVADQIHSLTVKVVLAACDC